MSAFTRADIMRFRGSDQPESNKKAVERAGAEFAASLSGGYTAANIRAAVEHVTGYAWAELATSWCPARGARSTAVVIFREANGSSWNAAGQALGVINSHRCVNHFDLLLAGRVRRLIDASLVEAVA